MGAIPARTGARRSAVLAWNTLGLLAVPGQLSPLTRLPLSLLPMYLVPLIILSHLRIFGLLREMRARN